jgi:hypothetical protein
LVEISVEQRLSGTSDELGWIPYQAAGSVQPEQFLRIMYIVEPPYTGPLWKGTVTLPPGRQPGQFRIVVKEFEHLATDVEFTQYLPPVDDGGNGGNGRGGGHPTMPVHPDAPVTYYQAFTFHKGVGRLVFADTFEV